MRFVFTTGSFWEDHYFRHLVFQYPQYPGNDHISSPSRQLWDDDFPVFPWRLVTITCHDCMAKESEARCSSSAFENCNQVSCLKMLTGRDQVEKHYIFYMSHDHVYGKQQVTYVWLTTIESKYMICRYMTSFIFFKDNIFHTAHKDRMFIVIAL